uniref:Uncharacterized protein n=1 Tax=Trichuris muris TaxID=70415 RepID=A0A5S6R5Q5_TRIMR
MRCSAILELSTFERSRRTGFGLTQTFGRRDSSFQPGGPSLPPFKWNSIPQGSARPIFHRCKRFVHEAKAVHRVSANKTAFESSTPPSGRSIDAILAADVSSDSTK